MKMQNVTLAGVDVGKTRHDIVVTTSDFAEQKVVRIKGRNVYGKKCVREEELGGGIVAPPAHGRVKYIDERDGQEKSYTTDNPMSAKNHAFILILAIGEKCCKAGAEINPNDQVSCPDESPEGINKSPYNEEDFFVHEDLLQTVIKQHKVKNGI